MFKKSRSRVTHLWILLALSCQEVLTLQFLRGTCPVSHGPPELVCSPVYHSVADSWYDSMSWCQRSSEESMKLLILVGVEALRLVQNMSRGSRR